MAGPGDAMIPLPADEAHHALRVVRLRSGDEAEAFDGCGNLWKGTLETTGKRDAALRVESHEAEPRPEPRLTLLQAWLHKPKAIEELLRRGTEAGITSFVFFRAARSERAPIGNPKWHAHLAEVCKQSGANWMPILVLIDDPVDFLRERGLPAFVASLEPGALALDAVDAAAEQILVVGPEGDFTAEEYAAITEAGARPVSLGPLVYRSEVAAVLAATLLRFRAGAYRPAR